MPCCLGTRNMKTKEQRRKEAKERQAAYDKMTPVQKSVKEYAWRQNRLYQEALAKKLTGDAHHA